jgi:aldose 1-epimerase
VVPDRKGRLHNVVLGHSNLEAALTRGTLGSVIGRYANRISNGGFEIDGTRYDLESVNKKTGIQIHGGRTGFHKQNWQIEEDPESVGFKKHDSPSITLRLTSPDGHEGFPGKLTVWVQYRLKDTDPGVITGVWLSLPTGDLEMEFRAKTEKSTHVNLTNHAYFNLRGNGSILEHGLRLSCTEFLEFDDKKIPTGKILPVKGTRFDFLKEKTISRGVADLNYEGLDHCFVVPKNGVVGTLHDKELGIYMNISTTQPGVQLYTANHFKGNPFPRHGAICFETQHYPDSPNRKEFPSTLLRPGEWLNETTKFSFRKYFDF